ncbi:MAG: resA 6 [Mucilaginibacter sp.]|nr:resA 6 [Mucilaginibacter sp.]
MKKLALILLLPGLVAINSASAQTARHLKLSSQYPVAGEKISFTYDPSGTPLEGKANPEAVIYFLDNKDNPAIDVAFKSEGKMFIGSFAVPENAKFFFFSLYKDTTYDSNDKVGYTYFVYKNQQPVQGAYASKAYLLHTKRIADYGGIKPDGPQAISLYQKEFELHPESKKDYQAQYASRLYASKDAATKALLERQIAEMANSGIQANMASAASYLKALKKTASADSLTAVIKTKFADHIARTDLLASFSKEKDVLKKEEIYNQYKARYATAVVLDKDPAATMDNMRLLLAAAFLADKKFSDFERFEPQIKNKAGLASELDNAAWELSQKDENIDEDAKLSKMSIDMTKAAVKNPPAAPYRSPKQAAESYTSLLYSYSDTYASILVKQGKFKEAYTYEAPVYKASEGMSAGMNENYSTILKGLGKNQEAMKVIEDAILKGRSTEVMIATLKDVYVKEKGSDKGFDAYYAPLREVYVKKLAGDIRKEMINKPAPTFALKDFYGKTVSLADLKGKVVVIDFWATWCVPCKDSFPGMQLAVTKYKDNPNVKFLFIDTYETIGNYQAEAKKFMADNKYTFNVLEDEKNAEVKHGKTAADYGVDGIPTKFILDGSGKIRFKKTGWQGSSEGLFDEVSIMIDLAGQAAATPSD